MKVTTTAKAVCILVFFSLCVACGEIGSLYSSNETYQVRALVNGSSLDSCSMIRSEDKIRPYFAANVVNDPDLIGLLVYLQDSRGEIVGERVRYVLQSYADGEIDEEIPQEDASTIDEISIIVENPENDTIEIDESAEKITETDVEDEAAGRAVWDFSDENVAMERWVFTTTQSTENHNDTIVVIRSFDEDLPFFSLPKNLEVGLYNLVFEALGERGVLSRTETDIFFLSNIEFNLKDISLYLPTVANSQLIPASTMIMLEAGLDFDSRLDPYVVWYRGKNIVREGKISEGAGSLLWRSPASAGFYSLRLEAFPVRPNRTLSGVSREIALPVSTKAVNTGYFFDSAPKYTVQNVLAEGTVYPEQVRLAVDVALAEDADNPVEKKTLVPPSPPELLHWYQFLGNYYNSAPVSAEERLIPVNNKASQWAPLGQSYGYSIGPDDAYSLSSIMFLRKDQNQGGGIFLLHIKPPVEGVILNAFFPLQSSSSEGVWMIVTREKDNIVLSLSTQGKVIEMPVYFASSDVQAFFPVLVEFFIRPHRMEAKLSLGEAQFMQHEAKYIEFSDVLTGEGRIRLGAAPADFSMETLVEYRVVPEFMESDILDVYTPSETDTASGTAIASTEDDLSILANTGESASQPVDSGKEQGKFAVSTIWNEFAVLYSELPLLYEELPKDPEETDDAAQNAGMIAALPQEYEDDVLPTDLEDAVLATEDVLAFDFPVENILTELDIEINAGGYIYEESPPEIHDSAYGQEAAPPPPGGAVDDDIYPVAVSILTGNP